MILDFDTIRSITFGASFLEETENGIAFHRFTKEEEAFYHRFENPEKLRLWSAKAAANTGIALKFETDSKALSFRAVINTLSSRKFYCIEFFVNGKRFDTLKNFKDDKLPPDYADVDLPVCKGLSLEKDLDLGEGKKRIEILLPWNHSILLQKLSLSDASYVKPVEHRGILLAYGDSITHGAHALYPSHKYITRLANALGMEERNKAVSAEEFRRRLGELAEDINPSLITVAYGTNDWAFRKYDIFYQDAIGFLSNIKEKYPTTPIVVLSPVWRADLEEEHTFGPFSRMEETLSELCRKFSLHFISCRNFIPEKREMFGDLRLHPNDEGFRFYFEGLMKKLKELNLC
jgi:lysophospholipase L1-like esterase